jgi:uncharacterized protein YndB with AHSA1/START domain
MTTAHVNDVFLRATVDQVWQAITDPALTAKYFHRTAIQSSFQPGTDVRYVDVRTGEPGADMVVGEIEICEPPHRLVHTWLVLYDAAMAEEPPGRVEWNIDAAGDGLVRLRVRHGELGRSPLTWAEVQDGWVWILDSLKSLLETGEPLSEPTMDLAPTRGDISGDWHRTQAIDANNSTWELVGRDQRSTTDDEDMLRRAYAAAYHWQRASGRGPENEARALWLQSKVWRAIGDGDLALRYADRCLHATLDAGLNDFDLAYAHEARARALQLLGHADEAAVAYQAAAAVEIADDEDREIVVADLGTWP